MMAKAREEEAGTARRGVGSVGSDTAQKKHNTKEDDDARHKLLLATACVLSQRVDDCPKCGQRLVDVGTLLEARTSGVGLRRTLGAGEVDLQQTPERA
jgi:hypothetical protein